MHDVRQYRWPIAFVLEDELDALPERYKTATPSADMAPLAPGMYPFLLSRCWE